jgi:hypothetical protein
MGVCFIFEVAVTTLIGTSSVDHINQINTDCDMQIYNPLTNCISDKNSPCFGCIHIYVPRLWDRHRPNDRLELFLFLDLSCALTKNRQISYWWEGKT